MNAQVHFLYIISAKNNIFKESEKQMKISRLTRVLAIVLVISMLPLWLFGCGSTADTASERLVEMMVGDGKLDDDNKTSKEYLARLDADVTNFRLYFNSDTGYWKVDDMLPGSSYQGVFYENLYKMMVAYATKNSEHYHDRKIVKMVKAGLNYLFTTPDGPLDESEQETIELTEKERLDAAEYLIRTLLILKEEGKLSKSKREEYALAVDTAYGAAYGSGVELARSAYIVIAYAALVDDEAKLEGAVSKLSLLANNVTNGAGLYADGSFLTDDKVASSGSYGVIAFSELVEIAYAIQGEACDFKKELKVPDYLYNWAMNSIVPSLYNGRAFASTSSSFVVEAEYIGGRAVSSLLALASYFEEAEDTKKANELRSIVKGYAKAEGSDCYKYLTTYGATQLEDVLEEKDIKAKTVEGAYSFASTDKLNILGPVHSASLSMSSRRTAKYETRAHRFSDNVDDGKFEYDPINGTNWYSGDGMLMLYTADYAPSSTYWAYVNGYRLPGTTVASIEREFSAHDGSTGNRYEAGSVTQDTFAVSAFYSTANNTDYLSTIMAKKSWFFFDGEIIALGAGIQSGADKFGNTNYKVESVIENIYYGSFDSISTAVAESGDKKLSNGREDLAASDAIYALGYGGIYAPADKNDPLKYTLRQTEGGNFVEVWLDHSADGSIEFTGKSYEYVIVPSTSMNIANFFTYVEKAKTGESYTVISNTEKLQAVKDGSSGVVGYTFWEAETASTGVSSDFACSIIIKETDTTITVSVADFTHTAAEGVGSINIGVSGAVASVSEGLTLNGTVLQVNRNIAANGQTLTIVINK